MTLATAICASFFSILMKKKKILHCFQPKFEGKRDTNFNENDSYFNINFKFPK